MEQHILDIINTLSNTVFIISDIMESKEIYESTIEQLYEYMRQGFEIKELRTCPAHFRFTKESEINTLQVRHLLTNLMFWEPLMQLQVLTELDNSFIVDCTKLSSNLIEDYINQKIIIPFREKVSNKKLNIAVHDLIYNLSRISTDFNIILGLSINTETFIAVAKRNARFNEIIRTKIPEGMQPQEIESMLNRLMKEQIEILKTEDNMLKPILLSGTGIKDKQLSEFAISGGLKPDLDGNTIPVPIDGNFLIGGLGNVTNYYIDALGGRKSVIMNKTVMGRSGHFARMVMLLSSTINLSHEYDCGTVNTTEYEVKTKEHLRRLRGRYYRLPTNRKYSLLEGSETELIGKRILVRTPSKCASKKGICNTCYGALYRTNKKHITIGGYAAAKITEPVSQNVLSSKHLLTTTSVKIEFNSEFYKFFDISANEIVLNSNTEEIDLNNYSLVFIKKNLNVIDEFDETDFNCFTNVFHVKNKKTGEMIEITEKDMNDLYLSPELMSMLNIKKHTKEIIEIDFAKIEDDQRLFVTEIENNELTRPLYNIMHLLNRSDRLGTKTIDEMNQKMLDLLIESKINVTAVHGELLIRPLIRSTEDILEVPNFRKYITNNDYQLLKVASALEKHPSVLIGLSFQSLGRQFSNPLTFRKKETSFIDPFFKEVL